MPKISIGSSEYNYKIKSSKRAKYIRIQINSERGLELIIPKGISLLKAENFLFEKREWILKHINKKIVKKNGYNFLGNKLIIEQQFNLFIRRTEVQLTKNKLVLNIPEGKEYSEKKIFEEWLKNQALKYIPERVRELGNKFGFMYNKVIIRGQKSRWGSCSKNLNLSFNYRLMLFKKEVIDYLIIHELCHTKEMNHSKDFWILVKTFLPDYKELKNNLKQLS